MKAKILGIMMAGGEGSRLAPLTRDRAKPAVPFGGKYRIIDFVLSNFVNSEIYSIYVLVQFKCQSLIEHLQERWRFGGLLHDQFISSVPAQMWKGQTWYQGNADAVYQNLHLIENFKPDFVLIFGADHIYRMDVRQMVTFHLEKHADVTIAAFPVPVEEGSSFGILQVDHNSRITGFMEKPAVPTPLPNDPAYCLASMGNYLFSTELLIDLYKKRYTRRGARARLWARYPSAPYWAEASPRLRFSPQSDRRRSGRAPVLARCGDPRCLLRRQHGFARGHSSAESV